MLFDVSIRGLLLLHSNRDEYGVRVSQDSGLLSSYLLVLCASSTFPELLICRDAILFS